MKYLITWVIFIVVTIAAFGYMLSLRKKVPRGQIDPLPLSKAQTIYIFACVLLSPIVAGAIFYYGWIAKMPKKAKTANLYSIFVALLLGIIAYLSHYKT